MYPPGCVSDSVCVCVFVTNNEAWLKTVIFVVILEIKHRALLFPSIGSELAQY